MNKPKMICPECGADMNHHAMKVDYGAGNPDLIDPTFGGVVEETHACPDCGCVAVRQA